MKEFNFGHEIVCRVALLAWPAVVLSGRVFLQRSMGRRRFSQPEIYRGMPLTHAHRQPQSGPISYLSAVRQTRQGRRTKPASPDPPGADTTFPRPFRPPQTDSYPNRPNWRSSSFFDSLSEVGRPWGQWWWSSQR